MKEPTDTKTENPASRMQKAEHIPSAGSPVECIMEKLSRRYNKWDRSSAALRC